MARLILRTSSFERVDEDDRTVVYDIKEQEITIGKVPQDFQDYVAHLWDMMYCEVVDRVVLEVSRED